MASYLIAQHALNYSNVITIGVAHLKEATKQMLFLLTLKRPSTLCHIINLFTSLGTINKGCPQGGGGG